MVVNWPFNLILIGLLAKKPNNNDDFVLSKLLTLSNIELAIFFPREHYQLFILLLRPCYLIANQSENKNSENKIIRGAKNKTHFSQVHILVMSDKPRIKLNRMSGCRQKPTPTTNKISIYIYECTTYINTRYIQYQSKMRQKKAIIRKES